MQQINRWICCILYCKGSIESYRIIIRICSVKVTVSVPVAPQSSLKPVLLVVIVTEPQLSIPEKVLFNQLLNSVVFPAPSHSTVKSLGGNIQVGSSASTLIVIYSLQVTPIGSNVYPIFGSFSWSNGYIFCCIACGP